MLAALFACVFVLMPSLARLMARSIRNWRFRLTSADLQAQLEESKQALADEKQQLEAVQAELRAQSEVS